MLTVSPEPQSSERSAGWSKLALLDEPEVRSLNALICELTSTRELHDALRLISEHLRAFLGARFVAVVVFEDEGQEASADLGDAAAIHVPLRVMGRNTGEITAYLDEPRELSDTEARALDVIAAVAAVTLDNAKRLQRERKRLTQAEAVNNLGPGVAVARTREELARLVVAALTDQLHYDGARLLWRRGESEELICLASTGNRGNVPAKQGWEDGGVAARVLHEGTPLVVRERGEPRETEHPGVAPGLRSLLAVPVRGAKGMLGVLEVGARSPRAFDNTDLDTLATLAALVAAVGERIGPQEPPVAPGQIQDRTRHELLSVIVHDLRGPLSLVKGYATTMLRLGEALDGDKTRRFLTGIDEAADQLALMLDHLAGASRLESGQFQPKLRQVDLIQLTTEAVERLRPQLGEHPISLELPGEVLPVRVDPEHVGRALGNLLLNAARRSPDGGRITVRISGQRMIVGSRSLPAVERERRPESEEGYGVVEVRDEGPGIPREDLSRVFDKLHRLPGSGGRKKGSGLELYVAKRIIEAHGGQVWAGSELEQGSTFGICLPLAVGSERGLNGQVTG